MSLGSNLKQQIVVSRGSPDNRKLVWSPFVTKLEFRLRQAQVKYDVDGTLPMRGPKGKIPFINVFEEGKNVLTLGDSAAIIAHLIQTEHLPDLNARLTPAQRLEDAGLRALVEDRAYFLGMSERWVQNYYAQRDGVMAPVPWPMRVVVGLMIYRNIAATLQGQGTGRHSFAEQEAARKEIFDLLEAALAGPRQKATGSAPFWVLGGEQPTEADATLFGFLASTLVSASVPSSQRMCKGMENIMDYAERIYAAYFTDYEKWL